MKSFCGVKLQPGAICEGTRGYCDVFQKCRRSDEQGPLTRLQQALFGIRTINSVRDYITVSARAHEPGSLYEKKIIKINWHGRIVRKGKLQPILLFEILLAKAACQWQEALTEERANSQSFSFARAFFFCHRLVSFAIILRPASGLAGIFS